MPFLTVKTILDSEIFEICLREAEEKGHRILEIDTSEDSVAVCVQKVLKVLHTPS